MRRSFITGIKGTKLSKKEVSFLKKYKPWGIILFSRNINSISQTQKLTSQIKKSCSKEDALIMLEQESGFLRRVINE